MKVDISNYKEYNIGTKAKRLFEMESLGLNVPNLFCITRDENISDEEFQKLNSKQYAIRSSCNLEDGKDFSFAGQFETYLNVPREDIEEKIHSCFEYINSENIQNYLIENKISKDKLNMNVIIQEQIEAEFSGVVFTANPQGILNEIVIVVGKGLGNNVVEDKENVTTYYYNKNDKKYNYEKTKNSPELSEEVLNKIVETAIKLENYFGFYQDIEYAIKKDEIYFLQSRNITTLDMSKEKIVLDNSNIVESYPGITLPLSQSFAKEVYYKIFKQTLSRLTSYSDEVEKYEDMLKNMVSTTNGKIYYQISNFYDYLMFLPFNKKIIPIWQKSLGIKDTEITRNNNKIGFKIHCKVVYNFFKLLRTNRREMRKLIEFIEDYLPKAREEVENKSTTKELLEVYDKLLKEIILKWDMTLVNDMYAFIFVSLVHNKEYISKVTNLESMKPIIALKNIKTEEDKKEYINNYGDRILEELKLETKTYRTNPELLDKQIEQYKDIEVKIPNKEDEKQGFFVKRAIEGIKNRETSRLYRTRIYGLARDIFLKIGNNYKAEGKIEQQRDIFYLTIDEIREGENYKKLTDKIRSGKDYKELIEERKLEYKGYEELPEYSRLVFLGKIIDKKSIIKQMTTKSSKILYGTSTSWGVTEGEVLVINNSKDIENLDSTGKIIVTKSTDPGWVFLISKAQGIIAEKGSLLSHTAIISRELGKPAIVGVENVCEILKDGQKVKLDADRGIIECLN